MRRFEQLSSSRKKKKKKKKCLQMLLSKIKRQQSAQKCPREKANFVILLVCLVKITYQGTLVKYITLQKKKSYVDELHFHI